MADLTRQLIRLGTIAGLALGGLAAGPKSAATAGGIDLQRACSHNPRLGCTPGDFTSSGWPAW